MSRHEEVNHGGEHLGTIGGIHFATFRLRVSAPMMHIQRPPMFVGEDVNENGTSEVGDSKRLCKNLSHVNSRLLISPFLMQIVTTLSGDLDISARFYTSLYRADYIFIRGLP